MKDYKQYNEDQDTPVTTDSNSNWKPQSPTAWKNSSDKATLPTPSNQLPNAVFANKVLNRFNRY